MRHIKIFDSLRGIMALWVAVIHTIQSVDIYVPSSLNKIINVSYAVDIFIMLSGFVIFLLLDKQKSSYSAFIIRRGFRLFPVYLMVLIISVLTIDSQISIWQQMGSTGHYWSGRLQTLQDSSTYFIANLIPHLLLLQGLFASVVPSSDYTFIEPAWSLSLEWQYYLVAPFIFSFIFYKKSVLPIILLSLGIALFYGQAGDGFLPDQIHFFIIGMASYSIYKYCLNNPESRIPVVLLCISLLLRDIPLVIWSVFFCLAIYQTRFVLFVRNMLENSVFQYIGKISYPVYVVHTLVIYPIVILVQSPFINLPAEFSKLIIILLTLIFTIICAHVLHVFIEKPGMNLGRNLSNKKSDSIT